MTVKEKLLEKIEQLSEPELAKVLEFVTVHLEPPISARQQLRPDGLCAGEFVVPDDFDAPLPDDTINAFEGQ